jgi:hypothetical protein
LGKSGVARRFAWFLVALAAAQAACAAVVEGYVLEQQSGRPVARARVTLQAIPPPAAAARPVFTDSRGYFSFRTSQAGAVLLTAEKRGYAPAYYGQRRWNGPGTPIVLEGDAAFRADIRLRRLGAVSGLVADENGLGLPDVPVFAYRDAAPPRPSDQLRGSVQRQIAHRFGPQMLQIEIGIAGAHIDDARRRGHLRGDGAIAILKVPPVQAAHQPVIGAAIRIDERLCGHE